MMAPETHCSFISAPLIFYQSLTYNMLDLFLQWIISLQKIFANAKWKFSIKGSQDPFIHTSYKYESPK